MGHLKLVVNNDYYIKTEKSHNLTLIVDNEKPSIFKTFFKNPKLVQISFEMKNAQTELKISGPKLALMMLVLILVGSMMELSNYWIFKAYGIGLVLLGLMSLVFIAIIAIHRQLSPQRPRSIKKSA